MRPVYLDISRLMAATDNPTPTGIDRVELEYARFLLDQRQNFVWQSKGRLYQVPRWLVKQLVEGMEQIWSAGAGDAVELSDAIAVFQRHAAHNAPPDTATRFLTRLKGLKPGARRALVREDRAEIARFTRPLPGWLAGVALSLAPGAILDVYTRIRQHRARVNLTRQIAPDPVYLNVSHLKLNTRALMRSLRAWQGVEVIAYIHDVMPITHPELYQKRTRRIHQRRLDNLARIGAKLLVNSQFTRNEIKRTFPDLDVIDVLEIGVSHPYLGTQAGSGARSGFVAVGTLEPRKNYLWLARAWNAFCAEHPEVAGDENLTIFGKRGWMSDEDYEALKALADSNPALEIIEGASDIEIRERLIRARALVSAAFVEGWGMPLAESIAVGTPVLASDIAAHREVSRNGGLYFDVGDEAGFHRHLETLLASDKSPGSGGHVWTWQSHFEKFRTSVLR